MGVDKSEKDISELQQEKNICDSLFELVDSLFLEDAKKEHIDNNLINERLNINLIYETVKETVKCVRDDHCNLMLALQNAKDAKDKNYLCSHTVCTTIIALIIGKYMKMPTHKLVELGVAALLHDIGMLLVPQELYLRPDTLTENEKKTIKSHPVYGYKILDSKSFPPAVKQAALEHHEREDGSGYPRKLAKEDISLNGKIIALACSYEAISAKRIYKKSYDPHMGLISILKDKAKYYDDAIQALVNSLSIYPIGMYVLMSNGEKGRVIDVDPFEPRFPIVTLLDEKKLDGKNTVRHTFSDGLYIVRPLRSDEI